MQFQNPMGALAFGLLIPLLLLYLLKQRYREQTVPSLILWEAALTQWEAAHPWQRWRKNLLFFLQAAIICSLSLALMKPVCSVEGMGRDGVIVLDVSLSMQAVEGGRSRLDSAKDAARNLVESMQPGEALSLMVCGGENRWLIHESEDKGDLLRLIDGLEAEYGESRPEEALKLAAALYGNVGPEEANDPDTQLAQSSALIHLFTDRDPGPTGENVLLYNLGQSSANVAATGLSYSRNSDGSLTALGILQNYGPATTLSAELWADGALIDVQEANVEENAMANLLFEGIDGNAARLELILDSPDPLAADNHAYCTMRDTQESKILLFSERNVFLEKALRLREDVALYKSSPAEAGAGELATDDFQLLVIDGNLGQKASLEEGEPSSPAEQPENQDDLPIAQNIWTFGPQIDGGWYRVEEMEAAALASRLRPADCPLARELFHHVDWENLRLAEARALEPEDPAAEILLYIGDSPLVIALEKEGRKELVFGFDLHQSNLPLEKDFPILVQNVLSWFLPSQGRAGQYCIGETVRIPLSSKTAQYGLLFPDGRSLEGQTQAQFTDTHLPGFYTLLQYGEDGEELSREAFAVNLPGTESDLRSASSPEAPDNAREAGLLRRQSPLLPLFILLALAILSLEWWVYHRG